MTRCDWNDDVHVVNVWAVRTPSLLYKKQPREAAAADSLV